MDHQQEQLNSDLTIIGLVLFILFITYYLVSHAYTANKLYDKFTEAKNVAIFLDDKLIHTKSELAVTRHKLIALQSQRSEEALISQIIKDIATSWNSGRKN